MSLQIPATAWGAQPLSVYPPITLYLSRILCKFRTGNSGIGNRAPILGLRQAQKYCLLCQEGESRRGLTEYHVVFQCKRLRHAQVELGLQSYKVKNRNRGPLLRRFLGGDGCAVKVLMERGSTLGKLLDKYFTELRAMGIHGRRKFLLNFALVQLTMGV